jgi:hypothetical protein
MNKKKPAALTAGPDNHKTAVKLICGSYGYLIKKVLFKRRFEPRLLIQRLCSMGLIIPAP